MVRKDLTEKVTLSERVKGAEGLNCVALLGVLQTEDLASIRFSVIH